MKLNKCQYIGPSSTVGSCTCNAIIGKNYCEEHFGVVYQKGTARRKRHKEVKTVDMARLIESLMNEAVQELEAEGFDCYSNVKEL
jgi:hypothetical protein